MSVPGSFAIRLTRVAAGSPETVASVPLAAFKKQRFVVQNEKFPLTRFREWCLDERPATINGDILSIVGELTNMMGWGAKERFAFPDIVFGLPTTVSGKDYRISLNPGIEVETVQFLCPSGSLTIQIAIQLPI